jgi:hypothetical protein
MAWSDIDFDIIVPGMITRGPSQISWADYLNTFTQALRERIKMRQGGTTPVDDLFTQFQITSREDIRDLIGAYGNLWSGSTYYSIEVMTDPLNASNYELTNQDLIDEIGQEVFDIIDNPFIYSFYEIYRADVFQALYTIYELTAIYRDEVSFFPVTPPSGADATPRYTTSGTLWNSNGNYISGGGDSFNNSASAFRSQWTQIQSSASRVVSYEFDASRIADIWTLRAPRLQSESHVIIKQTDLNDNIVNSEMAFTGRILSNLNRSTRFDGSPQTDETTISNDYPYVDFLSGGEIIENLIPNDVETDGNGTTFKFTYNNLFDQKPNIGPYGLSESSPATLTNLQKFNLIVESTVFINANNPALEFYIPPS